MSECSEDVGYRSVAGSITRERPLLRVSATRLRASASADENRNSDILMETKRDAAPPIPMAFTVLEMVR